MVEGSDDGMSTNQSVRIDATEQIGQGGSSASLSTTVKVCNGGAAEQSVTVDFYVSLIVPPYGLGTSTSPAGEWRTKVQVPAGNYVLTSFAWTGLPGRSYLLEAVLSRPLEMSYQVSQTVYTVGLGKLKLAPADRTEA